MTVQRESALVEGHRLSYLSAGTGPVVLLLHGLASDATTWDRALPALAARGYRVIALDLLGHGRSDKPVSGYELGDFADQIEGFLRHLGVAQTTVGGHSLGGAIAIEFADRYPDRAGALVLVCAGGLGREVHPVLRAATLPGVSTLLRVAVNRRTASLYIRAGQTLRLPPEAVTNLGRMGSAVLDADGRNAFFQTLHAVIEPGGQRGSMIELGQLSPERPTVIIWSEHDPILPVAHARAIHAHLPGSRLELFPGSGHQPHRRYPERFADVVAEVLSSRSGATGTDAPSRRPEATANPSPSNANPAATTFGEP